MKRKYLSQFLKQKYDLKTIFSYVWEEMLLF